MIAHTVRLHVVVAVGLQGVHRKGHEHGHWRMALAHILHGEVVVVRRSGRRPEDRRNHRREVGSHQPVGVRRGRNGRPGDRRSSRHVVVECDGGSRHDEGCSREEVRDGHSNHPVVVHHSRHGHGSLLESGNGSAREGVGSQIEAGEFCQYDPCRRDCCDVHPRYNGRWRP